MGARDQRWPASSHRSRWPRLAMGLVQCPRNQLTRGRRAGRGGPSAEPWLLRVAGGESLTLVAPYECPERAAPQRVPRRGPPAPPGALSTTFWDRTLVDAQGARARRGPSFGPSRPPPMLRGLLLLLGDEDGALLVEDNLAGDDALLEPRDGRQLVHHLEHDLFEHGTQPPRPRAALHRLAGDGRHGVVGELEPHLLQVEVLLVLLDDGVLGLPQDPHERRLVQVVQRSHHG